MSEQNTDATEKLKTGELLVKEGYIPVKAIQKVLNIQKEQEYISSAARKYKPFGQICVELGLLSADDLKKFLARHNNSILLGQLLIKMNLLKDSDLEKALVVQQRYPQRRLGEILIKLELVTEAQLIEAIAIQLDIPEMLPALELIDLALLDNMDPVFVQQNLFLPVSQDTDQVTVVMADPRDQDLLHYLQQHFGRKVSPAIAVPSAIKSALEAYEKHKENEGKDQLEGLEGLSGIGDEENWIPTADRYQDSEYNAVSLYEEEKPKEPQILEETLIVGDVSLATTKEFKQEEGMLNYLIKNALVDHATAIHVEPQDKYLRVRYRIDGVLHQKTALPQNLSIPMLARLKQLCSLNPELTNTPQRNRVQAKFNDNELELSIATYPSMSGENMVMMFKYKQDANLTSLLKLEHTSLSPLNLFRLQKILGQPGGLFITAGPARSGKTTTLYAAVNYLNLLTRSIVTAESPVELSIPGISQGNWTPESGGTFAEQVQSMSFMDPDVMMVSGLDSPEVVEATVELGLSGSKVLSAYQSFDTMGALQRLVTQGLETFLIASSNVTILSQRLVRKMCPHCKQEEKPPQEYLDMLGLVAVSPEAFSTYRPRGCKECNQMGYQGLVALHELLVVNEAIREALLNHESAAVLRELARKEGKLVSMAEDGYYKVTQGLTTLSEVQRVSVINEYDSKSPREAEALMAICKGEDKSFL